MSKNYDYYREAEYQDYYEKLLEERRIYREEMEADRLGIKKIKKQKICKPQLQLQK